MTTIGIISNSPKPCGTQEGIVIGHIQKRTRASRIFNLGRSLHQAVPFADPVHYRSKDTHQWEEIDNTLTSVTDTAGVVYLTNRAHDELSVEFHSTCDVTTVMMQDDHDCLLAWCLEDAQHDDQHRAHPLKISADACQLCRL